MPQSTAQIQAELDVWYAARTAAASGKTITIATSAGTRTLMSHDLKEINEMIDKLERQLSSSSNSSDKTHNFAVANFNHGNNP